MPRRTFEQVHAEEQAHDAVQSRVRAIRNSWYFANVYQFICLFGDVLKIDTEIDMDVFENECLRPEPSLILANIGLCILKWVSSHRGLDLNNFEEYTRRQYQAKAPDAHPFGDEEDPVRFNDLDLFTKLKVLHQLSVWVFWNPDRMREKSNKTSESDQTRWRMEPFGYDSQEREYFVLDDNRLYRKTLVLPQPSKAKSKAKQKPKPKKTSTPLRASKRQRLANGQSSDVEEDAELEVNPDENDQSSEGFGDFKWECLAVTLDEYKTFLQRYEKSKDPDERAMRQTIILDILPELERAAGSRQRKETQRLRELEAREKMATAKRSSRLAGKAEKEREEMERQAEEEKRRQELEMAHREQARQQQMELDRESRMQTREQRLKDREVKRILKEEEIAKLERGESVDSDGVRVSERNRKAQAEQRQRDLDELRKELEEEKWIFDCSICGRQRNSSSDRWEDDQDAIACERCGIWQHSGCHGIKPEEASRDDYHFVCHSCQKPSRPLKLNVSAPSEAKLDETKTGQKRKAQTSDPGDGEKPPKKKPGRPRKNPEQVANGLTNGSSAQQIQWAPPSYQMQGSFQLARQEPPSFQGAPQSSSAPSQYGFPQSFNAPVSFPMQPHTQPPAQHASAAYPTTGDQAAPSDDQRLPAYNGASNGVPTQASVAGASTSNSHEYALMQRHTEALATASSPADSASQLARSARSAAGEVVDAAQTPNAKPLGKDGGVATAANDQTPASSFMSESRSFVTPSQAHPVGAPESTASTRFLPSPHAGSNAAASGKSPVKHDLNTPASSFGSNAHALDAAGSSAASEVRLQQTPGGIGGSGGIPPGPVLSPSVNAGPVSSQAPTKRPTPEKPTGELAVPPPPVQYPPVADSSAGGANGKMDE